MSAPSPSKPAKLPWQGHMPVLDGVRGLAIAMVMALHFIGDAPAEGALFKAVQKLAIYGVFGVDLFFVLSGFLITGILYESKTKPGYFRNFYARRSLRIFPLYYGVLFVILVVLPFIPYFQGATLQKLVDHQWWAWLYGINVFIAKEGVYGLPYIDHFWSLAVEEHFYLMWPLVVFVLPRQKLLQASLALVAFSIVLRVWMAVSGVNDLAQYVLTPVRFDGLCLGAFLAVAIRERENAVVWLRKAGWVLFTLAVLGIGLTFAVNGLTESLRPAMVALRTSFFSALFGATLCFALTFDAKTPLPRFFLSAPMRFLGKYSYGLYVFHAMISYYLHHNHVLARVETVIPNRMLAVYALSAAGIALSIGVSLLSFYVFEKHFLLLKGKFEKAPERKLHRQSADVHAAGGD